MQEFDAAAGETDNVFEAMGRLLSTIGPAPTAGAARPTENFTYNADGQILTETNALGATTQFVYNSFGEKIKEIYPSPDGGQTRNGGDKKRGHSDF